MIIDQQVRDFVAQIETAQATGADCDAAVRALVTRLAANCAQPPHTVIFRPPYQPYPIDEDGFAVSFDPLTQEAEFQAVWAQNGFVVGKQIASPAQCAQTIARIAHIFNAAGQGDCIFDQPDTWANMPVDADGTPLLSRGFLEIYHDDALAQIRQNVRAYIQHVLIWRQADLWTSFDRVGVKLPDHAESGGLPLHVDQNPNIHPRFRTVQGVLALSDCPVERGTFCAVPSSRAAFGLYADMAKNSGDYIELDQSRGRAKVLASYAQAIPLRAGDMVSWDSRTTHANTANISDQTRMVAYVAAGPAREHDAALVAARMDALASGVGLNLRDALMHASKKPRFTNPDLLAAHRAPEQLNLLGKLLYGTARYDDITAPAVA